MSDSDEVPAGWAVISTTSRLRQGWPRYVEARLAVDGCLRIVTSETIIDVALLEHVIREARKRSGCLVIEAADG